MLCFLFFHCGLAQNHQYKIDGTAKGFPPGTTLFLSDLSDGSYQKIDSTKIINQKFHFNVNFSFPVKKVAVHTKDYSDRKQFWIDGPKTSIAVSKGKFGQAVIQGSKTELEQMKLNQLVKASQSENKSFIQYVVQHPTSLISAYALSSLKYKIPKDSVSYFYKTLSPLGKSSVYGLEVSDFLKYNNPPEIGEKYKDFEEANLEGKIIKPSDYAGKVLLLDFWGSWCVSCLEEQPNMKKLYDEYKDKGFEILGVATETNRKLFQNAIKRGGLTWENVSDFKGNRNKVALMYGITYYPTNFLIDRKGIIIAKDLDGEDLAKKRKEIFSE